MAISGEYARIQNEAVTAYIRELCQLPWDKENNKIPTENSLESSEEMNQVPAIYKQIYHSWYGNQTRDRGIMVQFVTGEKNLSSLKHPDRPWGPPSLIFNS